MSYEQGSVAIVTNFANLLQEENFDAVADILHDDFVIRPPTGNRRRLVGNRPIPSSLNKEEWLEAYRTAKVRPVFELPELGQHEKQVTRKGKVKFGPMSVRLEQTIELSDDGKIIKIDVNKL